jgi:sirohydrochlorin ferrochelatase
VNGPALIAVAHGSGHPDAAAAVTALADQVTRLAPVLDVRVAYLQHGEPSLTTALAEAGPGPVVVPLLLSTGYHLTTDLASPGPPGTRVTGPLGPDALLVTALTSRLAQAGVPAGTPVVLAAAGSSDPEASDQIRAQANMLAGELGCRVVAAFAAAGRPRVREAVATLREQTVGPVAIASYLLAPGRFQDGLRNAGADWVSEPLADHPAVAAVIIDRYRTARAAA